MVETNLTRRLGVALLLAVGVYAILHATSGRASDIQTFDGVTTPVHDKEGTTATIGKPGFDVFQLDSQRPARLLIEGAISREDGGPLYLDMETLKTLQPHSISTTTVVTDGVLTFEGVLMRSVLNYVGAHGATVTASALNGYKVDIPIKDFTNFDVLLAWSVNGARLKSDDKGPFWIVYPRDQHDVLQDIRYDYRWVWQLISLQVN